MPGPYRVAVVGFGMAGATTSYLLAKDGHRVTLLERANPVGAVGAGVLLQCSGQQVLRHLGVLDRVAARAAPIEELFARHLTGGTLVNNRYPDYEPGCRAYGVHRGVLFNALYDLVQTQPIDVRLGCEIASREVSGNEVWLRDGCGRRHGPFDFVVCGDGSRSKLRAACGLKAHVWEYDHGTFWVTAPSTAVRGRLLQIVRGSRYLCGLLPLGDGLTSMYWGVPLRQVEAVRKRGLAALKAEILAFAPEAAEVLDFVHDFDQLLVTSYRAVYMPRSHDRHTLFLGDACHAMSPHLGQGINLAMTDAFRFAASLREAPNPPAAFRAFVRAQRAYVRYYQAVTFVLSPFFQSDWELLALGRDAVLPWLPRLPLVRRQMLMTVAGLKGGFLKGRRDICVE